MVNNLTGFYWLTRAAWHTIVSCNMSHEHVGLLLTELVRIFCRKEKQRQAARTPNVVFVVAAHYQSLQIMNVVPRSTGNTNSGTENQL